MARAEVRPYEEVADVADALVQQYGGQLLLEGFQSTIDINVDPGTGAGTRAKAVVAL